MDRDDTPYQYRRIAAPFGNTPVHSSEGVISGQIRSVR